MIASAAIFGGAEYVIGQFGSPAQINPLGETLGSLATTKAAVHLAQQRESLILMASATKTFKVVGKPSVAHIPAPAGGAPIVSVSIPSPGTAQALAYKLLPQFGFGHNQFGCLNDIWSRESGWSVTAANASGAYGIPQALPGSKMASAGPNWQTNASTQIKWGLGYIKGRYGTPCNAWAFWQGNGWY